MDSLWHFFLVTVAVGYVIGSIPFGFVLTRLAGLGDIRAIGSGNIGATNVLRAGNRTLAAATLVLDGGKGALALALVASDWGGIGLGWGSGSGLIAGVAAVFGHNFPVWLKFRGGKGVATTLGVLLAGFWPVGIAACATWLLAAAVFRMSSLAALAALVAAPFYAYAMGSKPMALAAAILAVLSVIRHHANIRRILKGEEPRIGARKD